MKGNLNWFGLVFLLVSVSAFSQKSAPCFVSGEPFVLSETGGIHTRSEKLYIPIVFHFVLPEGQPPPTDIQISSQIDALNQNFQHFQSAHLIPEGFQTSIKLPNIEFCLASTDPGGQPTGAITRTVTSIPNIGQHIFSDGRQSVHHTVLDGQDAWDTDRYLNIWVAELESFAARTNFPESGRSDEDGIVIDPSYLGQWDTPFPRFSEGRTLVHEVGHYLNLQHPWGEGGCSSDDGLADTPPQDSPYFGCVSPSTARSCGSLDMIQNFMQFSDDPCLLYFTRDQVNMMHSILRSVRSGIIENGANQCKAKTENQTENIKILYDPSRYQIGIAGLLKDEHYKVYMVNMRGQLSHVFEVFNQYTAEIQARFLPNGLYVVVIETPFGIKREKVLINRP